MHVVHGRVGAMVGSRPVGDKVVINCVNGDVEVVGLKVCQTGLLTELSGRLSGVPIDQSKLPRRSTRMGRVCVRR